VTEGELRDAVLTSLGEIAPEADPATLNPATPIIDQLEIDSMDFLDFAVALSERTEVEVPERDYPDLASVDGCVAYLAARVQSAGAGPSSDP
jgi:acyl carrier protein